MVLALIVSNSVVMRSLMLTNWIVLSSAFIDDWFTFLTYDIEWLDDAQQRIVNSSKKIDLIKGIPLSKKCKVITQ